MFTARTLRAVALTRQYTSGDGAVPRKSNLYTRLGDAGKTSLFSGHRVSKASAVIRALGEVDELNGHVGLAVQHCLRQQAPAPPGAALAATLQALQQVLLDIGASIATPRDVAPQHKIEKTHSDRIDAKALERIIDELDSRLPPLTRFILPGGGLASAQLHVCRSVCRRAERAIVQLREEHPEAVDPAVAAFVNRLSDFFFAAARSVSEEEQHWQRKGDAQ